MKLRKLTVNLDQLMQAGHTAYATHQVDAAAVTLGGAVVASPLDGSGEWCSREGQDRALDIGMVEKENLSNAVWLRMGVRAVSTKCDSIEGEVLTWHGKSSRID
jgi:hypothetical protein